jgi:hypothetical protein
MQKIKISLLTICSFSVNAHLLGGNRFRTNIMTEGFRNDHSEQITRPGSYYEQDQWSFIPPDQTDVTQPTASSNGSTESFTPVQNPLPTTQIPGTGIIPGALESTNNQSSSTFVTGYPGTSPYQEFSKPSEDDFQKPPTNINPLIIGIGTTIGASVLVLGILFFRANRKSKNQVESQFHRIGKQGFNQGNFHRNRMIHPEEPQYEVDYEQYHIYHQANDSPIQKAYSPYYR